MNARYSIARCWLATLLATVMAVAFASRSVAEQPPSPLDEELIENFDSDPLDPIDRLPSRPEARRPGEPGDDAVDETRRRLRRELGTAADSEDDEPLLNIARLMREAQRRLEGRDAGTVTQDVQQQVVDDLDKLIEEARKAAGQCRSGNSASQPIAGRAPVAQPPTKPGQPSGQANNKPAAESSPRPRGAEGRPHEVDVEQVRAIIKELWGELPEHQRQQMVENPPEEFLPKYELLIEEYFRRLSEEKMR